MIGMILCVHYNCAELGQCHGHLARYATLWVAHAPGMPETFSPPPLVSDPGMPHDTCVTNVPWCMSGSLTRGGVENVPGIPGACATRNLEYLARGPWLLILRPLRPPELINDRKYKYILSILKCCRQELTHRGLVKTYGGIDLGQHWLR